MKLLEMFILLELRDRLAHTAETMTKKIAKRWDDKVNDGGMTGLPDEWRQALSDDILPDSMTMSRHDNWPEMYGEKMARWVVEWFSQADPTKNKKYTDWILRQWLSDTLWLEDVAKLPSILETFEEHRKKLAKMEITGRNGEPIGPPPQRRSDINAWKDYRDLAYAIRPLTGTRAAGDKVDNLLKNPQIQSLMQWPVPDPQEAFGEDGEFDIDEIRSAHAGETGEDGGSFDTMDWYDYQMADERANATTAIEKVYADDKLAVLIPNSRAAACELGRGTEWCTAATSSDNYFWHYAPDGPMYVIITDKHGKFQFHFETGQFANVHDEMLNDQEKAKLVQEYPQLRKIFGNQAMEHGQHWLMDPEMVTPEWVEKATNNRVLFGSDGNAASMLSGLPKSMNGLADEKALSMIENYLRESNPLEAWRYIRRPTEADLQAALTADDSSTRGYNPATGIMQSVEDMGLELSDETLEMAVARDGDAIWYIDDARIEQNPGWAMAAIQSQPQVLETALRNARGEPQWGELAEPEELERAKTIVAILRSSDAGRKAVINALFHNPDMIHLMSYWFGVEPFIWAMNKNRETNHPSGMKQDLQQIPADAEGWNWDAILQWFMQDESNMMTMDRDLLQHLYEVYDGKLPEQFVAALPQSYQQALGIGKPTQFSPFQHGSMQQ